MSSRIEKFTRFIYGVATLSLLYSGLELARYISEYMLTYGTTSEVLGVIPLLIDLRVEFGFVVFGVVVFGFDGIYRIVFRRAMGK